MNKKITEAQIKKLVQTVVETANNTYSPYSNFPVGAAVLGGSGKIYGGTNVENASYGLSVCAERNAVFSAVSNGEKKIKAAAVYGAKSAKGALLSPCGACLQVLLEFAENNDMPVFLVKKDKGNFAAAEYRLKDFLPAPFSKKSLGE